jgi:hypothetical protein
VSRTVDLFIRSGQAAQDLAASLGRLTRLPVKAGEQPGTWLLQQGEVVAVLRQHPYSDDGRLQFSRYPFVLTARTNGERLTESPEAAMLREVADRLREAQVPTMLVHDLEFRDRDAGPGLPRVAAEIEGEAG